MSEMTRAVIQMPYDMAMDGEISRQQFYNRAQTLLADFDTLAQQLQEAERLLREAAAELEDWRLSFPDANSRRTDVLTEQIDAFLTGSGGKA